MTRLLLGFAALTLLSACGVQGDLERPDPLWNSAHAIQSECRRERMHHETLDRRCRQTMQVTPTGTPTTPPQSPTAPSGNGTTDPSSPAPTPDAAAPTTPTP
jgi:hypothetical protein